MYSIIYSVQWIRVMLELKILQTICVSLIFLLKKVLMIQYLELSLSEKKKMVHRHPLSVTFTPFSIDLLNPKSFGAGKFYCRSITEPFCEVKV